MNGLSDIVGLNHFASIQLPVGRNQRRVDKTRQDHRYLYAFLPYLLVERLGKPNQAELRSGIGGAIGVTSDSGNRAYMSDIGFTLCDRSDEHDCRKRLRR